MSHEFQAVILAAGRGSRLAPHTDATPKALLPIGPRGFRDPTPTSFLRRQVELLQEHGAGDIVVVAGHLAAQLVRTAERWPLPRPLRFVENAAAASEACGSLHSLQCAMHAQPPAFDGRRPALFLDADIVYPRAALHALIHATPHSALLVSASDCSDDEAVRVYGSPAQPRFLGKGLQPELVAHEPCLGEAVGIVKLAPEDHALAHATVDWLVGDPRAAEGSARRKGFGPARRATEHEELTQRFMHYGKLRAIVLPETLACMECDDPTDYAHLRDSFYPRLLERER